MKNNFSVELNNLNSLKKSFKKNAIGLNIRSKSDKDRTYSIKNSDITFNSTINVEKINILDIAFIG